MDDSKKQFSSIDDYIRSFPEDVQALLEAMRQTIRNAAPEAEEAISYQMPTFRLNGNLVHFAAFKNHIGFYPAPSGVAEFEQELAPYWKAKGSIQFPKNQPLPLDLVTRIVQYRVKENLAKGKKKKAPSKFDQS